MIKRIQNTVCQCLTDAINLFLADRGLVSYINNFNIRMLPPTTQEEIDRRDNISARIQLANDTMNMLGDIDNPIIKFKILKSLLSNILTNTEVTELLQEYIDSLEEQSSSSPDSTSGVDGDESVTSDMDLDMPIEDDMGADNSFDLESDVMGD
jgi:hypothetical protein